jgi:dihydroflavonol-4-reductase
MDGTLSGGFWAGRRVLVTGGTGLLGYRIALDLLDAGAAVRVLALPPNPRHAILARPEIERRDGDVRDPAAVAEAVRGRDVVIHCAGVVGDWGPALARMHSVHVEGTANVLRAARAQGARVVHTSSIVAVGAGRRAERLDEESPFNLDRFPVAYVRAKRAAERLALDAAAAGGDVVVVNPAFLLGPEDHERSVMGQFCKRYWRGQVPVAPPGGFNLVDVRDAARGHLLAAERGRPGRRYILGGENRTFPELMALLAEVGGLNPRAVPRAPWAALAALAAGAELRARLTRRQPYPSWQQVQLHRYFWFYDTSRSEAELGFRARPLRECLADTHGWFSGRSVLRIRGLSRWWMRHGGHAPGAAAADAGAEHGRVWG